MKAQHDAHEHDHGSFYIATASINGRLLDRNRKNNHLYTDAGTWQQSGWVSSFVVFFLVSRGVSPRSSLFLTWLLFETLQPLHIRPGRLATRETRSPPPGPPPPLAS